ncbi:MAG: YraN family protein [Candidatus Omnitrophota bacterium]
MASYTLSESERCYLKNRAHQRAEFLKRKERILHPASVDIGSNWEAFAAEHLRKQGYEIWERNYRGSRGEIDLVANKGTQIVFVEVKARTSAQFGMPYEAIGRKKRQAMIRTAEEYLVKRDLLTGWDIRYDAASILAPKGEPPRMDYFEDVFRVEEEFY